MSSEIFSCNSYRECYCLDGACALFLDLLSCDIGWFGLKCTENLLDKWSESYFFWRVFFIVLFSLMAFLCYISLKKNLKKLSGYQKGQGIKFYFLMLRCPLLVIMLLLITLCVLRIIWLAYDPYSMIHSLRLYDRLMNEIGFSIMIHIYAIILLCWFTIYDEVTTIVKKRRSRLSKHFRPVLSS